MRASWHMLAAFTAGLIFFRWAGANGLADTALAARLVIALSVAAGVGAAWREARPRRQWENWGQITISGRDLA